MTRFEKLVQGFFRKSKKATSATPGAVQIPQDALPPLKPVQLPKIKAVHQSALSEQGWTTVTFSDASDPMRESLSALFEASRAFFALSDDYKSTFSTKAGSEEGWSRIEGEKEFITLRTIDGTPKELRDAAQRAWAETGKLLSETLGRIAESLDLAPEALTAYSQPCIELSSRRTATMLRLFRYEGHEAKVVAEPHCDLGLLSFVIGDTPGLEVWNRYTQSFWPIEKTYKEPAGSLLGGRQLQRLSNGRYIAGGHRVHAYGSSNHAATSQTQPSEGPYRYSIVFVLRAHSNVPIDTDTLTTRITGPFSSPLKCTAGELFREVKAKHFNINTGIKEREEQKRKLRERKDSQLRQNQQNQQNQQKGSPQGNPARNEAVR